MEGRWPAKLSLQLISYGAEGRTTSKSTAFPSAALVDQAAGAAGVQGGGGDGCLGSVTTEHSQSTPMVEHHSTAPGWRCRKLKCMHDLVFCKQLA